MGRRVIKASEDAMSAVVVGENSAQINGSNENFAYFDESGGYIGGPLSIRTTPDNIRIATSFTFPETYKAMLPSTTVNPQPILVANSPVEGFASFAQEVATLLGQLL